MSLLCRPSVRYFLINIICTKPPKRRFNTTTNITLNNWPGIFNKTRDYSKDYYHYICTMNTKYLTENGLLTHNVFFVRFIDYNSSESRTIPRFLIDIDISGNTPLYFLFLQGFSHERLLLTFSLTRNQWTTSLR